MTPLQRTLAMQAAPPKAPARPPHAGAERILHDGRGVRAAPIMRGLAAIHYHDEP